MKVDMLMPQMGESIAEATISKWLKAAGEKIEKDEVILEISTDKVDSEIPAPEAGVLSEVLFQEGEVVPVKTKIAVIDTEGTAGAAPSETVAATPAADPEPAPETETTTTPAEQQPEPTTPSPVPTTNGTGSVSESDRFYSPLVRSLALKHGVELSELGQVQGSGAGGRITRDDFMKYLGSRGSAEPATPTTQQVPSTQTASQTVVLKEQAPPKQDLPAREISTGEWNADGTKVVPMDNMRQAIAEHMVNSKQTSPHVYSVQEVDVSRIAQWRAQNKADFKKREGFNLSFTPFFLEAAVRALLEFPYVNCSVEEKTVILKKNINLGCAVALGNTGLIVPVIKNAEERNLVGLSRALNDLATRARSKKLIPDEVMDGTFTVTNPGVFGTMIGTPIINQPQVAILCLGAIKKRPVVVDNMIAIRDICYLTLSYDHRIVDGALGGQFLAFIREYLEEWDMNRTLY